MKWSVLASYVIKSITKRLIKQINKYRILWIYIKFFFFLQNLTYQIGPENKTERKETVNLWPAVIEIHLKVFAGQPNKNRLV